MKRYFNFRTQTHILEMNDADLALIRFAISMLEVNGHSDAKQFRFELDKEFIPEAILER